MAVKKTKKPSTKLDSTINTSTNLLFSLPERIISYRPSRKIFIILLIAGFLLLAFYKKEWFVAATVNGQPITTLDLFIRLNQQFRTTAINRLVDEKIILDEARKANVAVSLEEIGNKLKELEKSVGGAETLESLLSQQGQNKESIKQQIRLQLIVEKLYLNEATVSAAEVDEFLQTSRGMLEATESAAQRKEAEEALRQQKVNQIFSQKFQELKQKADVKFF